MVLQALLASDLLFVWVDPNSNMSMHGAPHMIPPPNARRSKAQIQLAPPKRRDRPTKAPPPRMCYEARAALACLPVMLSSLARSNSSAGALARRVRCGRHDWKQTYRRVSSDVTYDNDCITGLSMSQITNGVASFAGLRSPICLGGS